jgi:hypothetical protein
MSYRDDYRAVEREGIWTLPRVAVALIVLVIVFAVIGFISTGADLATYKFWAPKQANAERQVFVNTNSYIQGKTDYLSRLRFEYQSTSDPDQKAAMRTMILSEAANVDNSKLPADLAAFIQGLKGQN